MRRTIARTELSRALGGCTRSGCRSRAPGPSRDRSRSCRGDDAGCVDDGDLRTRFRPSDGGADARVVVAVELHASAPRGASCPRSDRRTRDRRPVRRCIASSGQERPLDRSARGRRLRSSSAPRRCPARADRTGRGYDSSISRCAGVKPFSVNVFGGGLVLADAGGRGRRRSGRVCPQEHLVRREAVQVQRRVGIRKICQPRSQGSSRDRRCIEVCVDRLPDCR